MNIEKYNFPDDLSYDSYHGWVKADGELLVMGVTDLFQQTAGEIIFVEIPVTGRKIEEGQPFSSIESGKWVGRLKAPLNGEIVEVNDELRDFPYLLNESPYDDGWIIKIRPDDMADMGKLMTTKDEQALKDFVAIELKKIAEQ